MNYGMIILVLTLFDQVTKYMIYQAAKGQVGFSIPIIKNFLHITYVENHGMIFGLAQGKINLVTIFSTLLIIFIIFSEYKNFKDYTKWTKVGISIIAAGALGNMIDRVARNFVIDMIDFRGIWNFVFNVADMYVHIGIYIIVIDYLVRKYKMKKGK
ncbi:signal peptidase II [Leptotrichia sp. oral taxon 847]|uniref:signal peptidase II n=1 Tax=Leptotrichia sp. oral taxon 847 TaxID=1785996 RepID=UPI0007682CE2|nr:signal peptidase II [Leptotrichia sp. oral taxon 847]AMD95001.1 signal peptidase II [Leptotrichia sp. oral taxon 847]